MSGRDNVPLFQNFCESCNVFESWSDSDDVLCNNGWLNVLRMPSDFPAFRPLNDPLMKLFFSVLFVPTSTWWPTLCDRMSCESPPPPLPPPLPLPMLPVPGASQITCTLGTRNECWRDRRRFSFAAPVVRLGSILYKLLLGPSSLNAILSSTARDKEKHVVGENGVWMARIEGPPELTWTLNWFLHWLQWSKQCTEQDTNQHDARNDQHCTAPSEALDQNVGEWRENECA